MPRSAPTLFGARVRAALLVATASHGVDLGERSWRGAVMRLLARGLPLPPGGGRSRPARSVAALFGDDADPADVEAARAQVAATKLTTFAAFHGPLLTVDQRAGFPALDACGSPSSPAVVDPLMPATRARALRLALPHATFVEMPRAGHMLPYEATDVVADEVTRPARRAGARARLGLKRQRHLPRKGRRAVRGRRNGGVGVRRIRAAPARCTPRVNATAAPSRAATAPPRKTVCTWTTPAPMRASVSSGSGSRRTASK